MLTGTETDEEKAAFAIARREAENDANKVLRLVVSAPLRSVPSAKCAIRFGPYAWRKHYEYLYRNCCLNV